MSFPRYPKYKASGVEWVGEIPKQWVPKRLRFMLHDGSEGMKIGPFGSQLTSDMLNENGEFKVYGQENIIANDFTRGRRFIGKGKFNELAAYEIVPGDLLITMMGTSGRCDVAPPSIVRGIMDSHLLRMRLTNSVRAEFVRLLIDEAAYVKTQIQLAGKGSIMHGLNSSIVKDLLFFVPSFDEQTAILAFLDRETGKIDALVAEQRRLMELLKEKRQAVISHAVTRGLNPAAPLKDSGIDWLGQVPAHWNVTAVAYRYSVQLGKMLDSTKITGEHLRPYLRVFDVQWGEINTEDLPQMDFDDEARVKFRLKPGDLLVNEGGSYPGRSAIWTGQIEECYYQKALHRMRPHHAENDSTRYLYYLMSWAANQGVFVAGGNETTIEHLPAEKLRRYRFAFPPLMEQLDIADFLEQELAKFDTLTTEAQRAIDLLQERRTALISAAVTGQIDVRETVRGQG